MKRVIAPIPREIVEIIDDYRFKNRVKSRAEATRQLIQLGLDAPAIFERGLKDIADMQARLDRLSDSL